MRRALFGLLLASLSSCSGSSSEPPAERPRRSAVRVSRGEQEVALARCGEALEAIEGPGSTPTFAALMSSCSGVYAGRRCRTALAVPAFSRDAVAEACRADYCEELGNAPLFCTVELPSDREFLTQFGGFSRVVLRRDLVRLLGQEGAVEIADLFGDLIDSQAARE